MTIQEFSDQFDVLYNNITSNQAPGLNEYEKSIFLTKAQEEVLKNYFNPKSNARQEGFDDTRKRQADFSTLMSTQVLDVISNGDNIQAFDPRAVVFKYPKEAFIIINEIISRDPDYLSVVPIKFSDYERLMAKPYKFPPKYQAWRLITNSLEDPVLQPVRKQPVIEVLSKYLYDLKKEDILDEVQYTIRFIKRPAPIIVDNLGTEEEHTVTIHGEYLQSKYCELPEELHEEILQRAVELAKASWASDQNTAESLKAVTTMGQRSE